MGKQKKTRKFAAVKRMITPKDARIKKPTVNPNQLKSKKPETHNVAQTSSALFFSHNMSLGPPCAPPAPGPARAGRR